MDVCVISMLARVATAVAAGSILAYVTETTGQLQGFLETPTAIADFASALFVRLQVIIV